MRPRNLDDLNGFHAYIMTNWAGFTISPTLLDRIDDEYMGYLRGGCRSGYYLWLAAAVQLYGPSRVLELGTHRGASSVCIYSGLKKTNVFESLVTCDREMRCDFIPAEMWDDSRFRFVRGDVLDLSIFGRRPPAGIDFLFLDTVHTSRQLRLEWERYQPLCTCGGLIVIDDINLNDMRDAWEEIPFLKLDLTQDCHHSGFGVVLNEVTFG